MGFLLKAIGVGVAVAGFKKIRKTNKELEEAERRRKNAENRRKNTVCRFDGAISKDEFNEMVKRSAKGIRRVASLYAADTVVHGLVRSQSGISEWGFTIDFNDYGKLTGAYWISSENTDSEIPGTIANRIAQQIKDCCSAE